MLSPVSVGPPGKDDATKTLLSVLLVLALALAAACAPKVNDPADVQAIRALMDGYFEAANAKDSSALDAVLTDKTILLEPHMKPLVGRDAIGKMHQAFLDSFDTDAKGPAIVSLAGAATGSDKGTPFADGSKGLDVFVKRDGRWQVVYSQMTTIKE